MDYSRDELLLMSDADLINQCQCDRFRGSGPGGQHRNTSDTAVRLRLKGTKISAYATGSRSQHRNKREAVRKLRLAIAFSLREEALSFWNTPWNMGKNDRRYPQFIAHILDALALSDYRVGDTAKNLQISTGKLTRILSNDSNLWKFVNEKRDQLGLKPLKG